MCAEAQWSQRDSYSLGVATLKYWLLASLQQLGYNRGLGAQTQKDISGCWGGGLS